MKLKKIVQNSIMETFFHIIIAIIGLLKIRFIISSIGSEMNGYYQFINNIISYIVLAEAGISSAILYKMYKPIADNDKNKVSELFNGSKKILKSIGLIFIGLAILVLPILYLYTKEVSLFLEISFCFFMLIIAIALPYLCGTRSYTTLLTADQKRFTYSLVYNISRLLTDIFIIIFILITKTIISIVIINLIFKVLETLIITSYCKKKYYWIDKNLPADKSAKNMSKDMLCHQIGGVIFNNVDTLLLMTFLGPISVSIYSSYNYIVTFLKDIIDKNNQMISNIFGYSFAKKEKNLFEIYKSYSSIFAAVSLIICICFVLGARSFINLWIENDNYILSFEIICSFALIIMLNILATNISTIFQANGLFKESRFFPIIESIINLILSVILLYFFDIIGILNATAIAILIGLFLRTNLLKNKVFIKSKYVELIKRPLIAIITFIILCIPLKRIEQKYIIFISSYLNWFSIMIITFIIATIIILLAYYIFDKSMKINFDIIIEKLKKRKRNE